MKLIFGLVILLFLPHCSFDKKSGIWKNENFIQGSKSNPYKDFKKISSSDEIFEDTIILNKTFSFKLSDAIKNDEWKDFYYNNSNNFVNFDYTNENKIIFQSKKLTRFNPNNYLLFKNKNLIINDKKGNIIIYSIEKKEIISKFNFYKKKYKNLDKKLYLIVENNLIFVSDNLGYLYVYDYINKNIVWAKNFKVPFKSNLKINGNNLIAANQNNNIIFFDKKNGQLLKSIPTEETLVTNRFVNNFSFRENNLFFLNSFGSLYSINIKSKSINWFINLNQALELTTTNLFFSTQIVNYDNIIVVSTSRHTYFIDSRSGNIISKKNFSSNFKPIINNDYVFFLTKKNMLIASKLKTGEILYSYKIDDQIKNLLNKRKKFVFTNFMLANNKLLVFLNNSFISFFNIRGNLEQINKIPKKINSNPIFINGSILYLDVKNKLKIIS